MILWSLSLAWFSFLAWVLSTSRLQKKLLNISVYIDGICGLLFATIGVSILSQSIQSLLA